MNGKKEHVKTEGYDVVVAGGGMAGVCAGGPSRFRGQ